MSAKFGSEDDNPIFQHDGAPSHTAIFTNEWLMDAGIVTLDWPSNSPDLNPIENFWACLTREVYQGQRQFDNVEDLTDAVMHAWGKLSTPKLRKLIRTMPKRCGEVLVKKGGATHYEVRRRRANW